jgi:hypothetical protein
MVCVFILWKERPRVTGALRSREMRAIIRGAARVSSDKPAEKVRFRAFGYPQRDDESLYNQVNVTQPLSAIFIGHVERQTGTSFMPHLGGSQVFSLYLATVGASTFQAISRHGPLFVTETNRQR